jgi:hypothetical protein
MNIIQLFFVVLGILFMMCIIVLFISVLFIWATGGFKEDNMMYDAYDSEENDAIKWGDVWP